MRKNLLAVFCGLCSLLCWKTEYAQVPGNPQLKTPVPNSFAVDKTPTRLSPELKKISNQNNGPNLRQLSIVKPVPTNDALDKYIQYQGTGIVIDVTVKGNVNTAKAELQ